MALLFIDSFDHYLNAADKYTATTDGNSWITTGRHGKGIQIIDMYISFDPVPQSGRCCVGAAFKSSALGTSYFRISDQGHHILGCNLGGDGAIEITMANANGLGDTEVVCRSEADTIKLHQWNYIELDTAVVKTVPPGENPHSTFMIENLAVYVDGVNVLSGPSFGPTGSLYTHLPSPFGWNGVTVSGTWHVVDDFYICDGFGPAPWNAPLGDVEVTCLRPNAAGAATQWGVIGAATNWQAVRDTTPDDDATKVISAGPGVADLYNLDDINTNNGIIGAQLLICARRTQEGFATLTPLIRHGGITTDLRPRAVGPTYFYRNRDVFVTMPNGDPLTDANINALQAGMRRDA